jgi:hypothetical protein
MNLQQQLTAHSLIYSLVPFRNHQLHGFALPRHGTDIPRFERAAAVVTTLLEAIHPLDSTKLQML